MNGLSLRDVRGVSNEYGCSWSSAAGCSSRSPRSLARLASATHTTLSAAPGCLIVSTTPVTLTSCSLRALAAPTARSGVHSPLLRLPVHDTCQPQDPSKTWSASSTSSGPTTSTLRWPLAKTSRHGRSIVGLSGWLPVRRFKSRSVSPKTTRPIPAQ